MNSLLLAVLLAMAWVVVALAFQLARAKTHGKRTLFSRPAGKPSAGVWYAFTLGMAPWAKESIRLNPFSYAAGVVFHLGVFAAFALLLAFILRLGIPSPLLHAGRFVSLAGGACGLALFVKRLIDPRLRGLSVPDDFVSNLLTSAFALLASAWTLWPSMAGLWLVESILLLLYIPMGKIRHCCFFFTTRYHLGAFFGRRGTFPPGGSLHA